MRAGKLGGQEARRPGGSSRHGVELHADHDHIDVVSRIAIALNSAVRDVAEAPAGDDAVALARMERDSDAALREEVHARRSGGHAIARPERTGRQLDERTHARVEAAEVASHEERRSDRRHVAASGAIVVVVSVLQLADVRDAERHAELDARRDRVSELQVRGLDVGLADSAGHALPRAAEKVDAVEVLRLQHKRSKRDNEQSERTKHAQTFQYY